MPSGDIHYRYFKSGYILMLPASIITMFMNFDIGLGILAGYTFHRWCDNDLDIMGASACEGRQVNELPVVGHFLFGISSTYGSMFRRYHRKFITHFPFVSTAIRLLFFGMPIYFMLKSFDFNFNTIPVYYFIVSFWIGLSLADSIHYVLDMLYGD